MQLSFLIRAWTRACLGLIACLLSSSLMACGDDDAMCTDGFTRQDNRCVRVDAGAADAGPDALVDAAPDAPDTSDGGPDAGPCGECAAETPMCDTAAMECVECLAPADCSGAICSDSGACVECTDSSHCTEPGASVCAAEGESAGTCVPCVALSEGGDATDCDGVMDGEAPLSVCDDSGDAPVCVECTAMDESACGANVCDVLARSCATDIGLASAEACAPCVSDRQCEEDHACVPVGAEEPRAHYCLKDSDAAGGCEQPFLIAIEDRESLSGALGATYCGINEGLARCENVRGLLDNAMCPGGLDNECPEGGLCRRVGGLSNRCTYECGGEVQCDNPPNPGATCGNMGAGVDYCGG